MFKAVALGLALISAANTLGLQHEADAVNVEKLTDDQKGLDKYLKDKISSLKDVTLSQGEQDGNKFKFQYVGNNAPFTITQVDAEKVEDGKYRLTNLIQSVTGPVNGGKLVSTTQAYSVGSWDDALKNLKWN